jgi:DNA invertase Pin-like site-specific DNA recombinase
MKYVIYARKSSEAEERQMLSIPAQLEEMRKLVVRNPDLPKECVLLEESKSAKVPGQRNKFNELLTLIRTNQVNTLLVWQPDRISRNPLDSAQIVSLMDDDKLTRVITPTQTFANNPMD